MMGQQFVKAQPAVNAGSVMHMMTVMRCAKETLEASRGSPHGNHLAMATVNHSLASQPLDHND